MARKNLVHEMPPLPDKVIFKARDHKTKRLLEILRGIAVTNQKKDSLVFYPVRKVAKHFRAPISTVARVYGHLEKEGILTSVRGSKTLLQGLQSSRHLNVLSVVGVPAAVAAFVTFQDYRMFFIRTRRELRTRGFSVAMVLFEQRHIKTGQLTKRILKHEFDTIIWYRPDVSVRDVVDQVADSGIRILGVSDGGVPPIQCRYEIRREIAIKRILQDWKTRSRIKTAAIVRIQGSSSAKEEMLETLLEEEQLGLDWLRVDVEKPDEFLKACGNRRDSGIIFPSRAASNFAFRAPEALMRLMKHSRVAFVDGPPSIAFTPALDVPGDFVVMDWQLIAERIVTDLISKIAFDQREVTTFEAEANIQAPLNRFAQTL
jgi:hypothetical protein